MPPAEFYDLLKRHHSTKLPVDAHAAHWMTLLGRDTPGCMISEASMAMVPMLGSHDSGTYGIHEASELAADAPPAVRNIVRFSRSAGKRLVSYWSRTQSTTIIEQLLHGVRYFDIRLSPVNRKKSEKLVASESPSSSYPATPVKPPIPSSPSTTAVTKKRSSNNLHLEKKDGARKNTSSPPSAFTNASQGEDSIPPPITLSAEEAAGVVAIVEEAITTCRTGPSSAAVDGSCEEAALIDSGDDEPDEAVADGGGDGAAALSAYPPIVGYDAGDEDDLWVSHGSLSIPLSSMIEEIRIFYDQILPALGGSAASVLRDQLRNNLEVIVFDIQKVTSFTPRHVQQLVHMLRPLESLLVRKPLNMATPLKDLWQTSQRIFILYPTTGLADVEIALKATKRRRDPLTLPPGSPSTWECPVAFFHPRDASMIRSHWHNKNQEVPLYQDLLHELQTRSLVPPEERTQLHVLQAILTPKPTDMASAILSKKPRSSSILEFAMQANSSILTMWEAHGQQHIQKDFPIRYRRDSNGKGGDTVVVHIERNATTADGNGPNGGEVSSGFHETSMPSSSSRDCAESPHRRVNNNAVVDDGKVSKPPTFFYSHSIEAHPSSVDARNVLMLDFIHIGRSASGLNAFYTGCWYPCVDRFCRTIANPPRPLQEEGRTVSDYVPSSPPPPQSLATTTSPPSSSSPPLPTTTSDVVGLK